MTDYGYVVESLDMGIVTGLSPLTYDKRTAHDDKDIIATENLIILDAEIADGEFDTAVQSLYEIIKTVSADTKSYNFKVTIYGGKHATGTWNMTEPLADILINDTSVGCRTSVLCTPQDNNRIRTVSAYIAEMIKGLMVERATMIAKGLVSSIPTTTMSTKPPSSTGSTGSTMTPAEREEAAERIVEWIKTNTKADVVKPKETLDDYICNLTLKEELEEIKDFFEHADTYKSAGIQIPKGVLFKGVPGTGKTYAARCIAGSVSCHFMTCTASALQGMYVGSGAENIRNVFKGAVSLNEASDKGVIIFIDELDSLGSREKTGGGGDSGESDRTLNQLLAEMSGFEDKSGIMVMSATNYPERIDSALMRSGRFSRQITIDVPDAVERKPLCEYYFNKILMPISGTDMDEITALTENLTPADIKEVSNEAAILSVRKKLTDLPLENINEAINKVITKNIRRPDGRLDTYLVAAHEAGHVMMERILFGTTPIKVTNYSYGDSGGFTQTGFKKDGLRTEQDYHNECLMLLGGRAGEHLLTGKITNGASDDLRRAKNIIRHMYETFHFSVYEKDKLENNIIQKIHDLTKECVNILTEKANLSMLENVCKELSIKRVLYARDIIALTPSLFKIT